MGLRALVGQTKSYAMKCNYMGQTAGALSLDGGGILRATIFWGKKHLQIRGTCLILGLYGLCSASLLGVSSLTVTFSGWRVDIEALFLLVL